MKKFMFLKGIRVMQGLTQKDMAQIIGKSESTYRKKENGEIDFFVDEMLAIRKRLNRTMDELFGEYA